MAEEQETKQDLIKAAKSLPPTEKFSLQPRTFDEAFRFANLIAESTLIPKDFQKSPANVLIAVQYGMEMGVSPMQALQSMYVVNGRPSIFGDLLPAIVFQSGLCEQFDEEYDPEKKVARCTVKRKGFKAITRTFSWEDAQRAKAHEYGKLIALAEKETYKSYPQRMLPMRARSWAVRDAFPDVLKGLAIKEEMDDAAIEVEAEKATPIAIPHLKGTAPEPEKKTRKKKGETDGPTGSTVAQPNTQTVSGSTGHGGEGTKTKESPSQQTATAAASTGTQAKDEGKGEAANGEGIKTEESKPVKSWRDEKLPMDQRLELWIEQIGDEEFDKRTDKASFFRINFGQVRESERAIELCQLVDKRQRRA